ncbi:MAG: hypothetical protein IKW98_11495 [Prevotella sp.]|nr:hypothetical protein [Prevotella sp.]
MGIIEHHIFSDIPNGRKNGRFHSAVLTTYAVDLIHFDRHLINMLHRKQICSINILADANQLEKEMEYVNPRFMKGIGKEYSILGIHSKGAFHPKINFFVGDDAVLVVFGTGNLTVTGHGKNHEVFTGLMVDDKNEAQRPLIEECWRYITRFSNQYGSFEKNRILRELPENCSMLSLKYNVVPHKLCKVQNGLYAALLYNDESSSILKQITNIVPLQNVLKVTVVSPFFDEKGESLISLADLCPKAKIEVLIHQDCTLPPCNMPADKRVCFYDFKETARGKMNFKVYDRQLHAKIFHFKTPDKEFCMIGSANATTSGLGTIMKRGINEEFGIIYVSSNTDFLSELGLKARKKIDFKIKEMARIGASNGDKETHKYKIMSAHYDNGMLSVFLDNPVSTITIAVYDGSSINLYKVNNIEKGICCVEANIGKDLSVCYICTSEGECLSNKVFINNIAHLETTNPSQTSRSLNRFIAQIEDQGYDGLEVADMLTDIMWDLVNETDDDQQPRKITSSSFGSTKDNPLPEIKYNSAYDNDEVHSHRSILVDRTSRLIECIEESIRKKIRSIDDAITDEEEEGEAETSNDREVVEYEEISVSKKNIKGFGELSSSVLSNYSELIDKRIEQIKNTVFKVVTKDDLNFFSLSIFASVEICYLNRHKYQFDLIDPINRSCCQKQLYDSLDRSMNKNGIEALEKFAQFCYSIGKPSNIDDDFKKKANRTMKYAILFATLFYKNATHREKHLLKRVLGALRTLVTLYGIPALDVLESELAPLSERYDYAFRFNHVRRIISMLEKCPK